MVPSGMIGALTNSSSSSAVFYGGDGQSYTVNHSEAPCPNQEDFFNCVVSSGPSVDASSMITDANSSLAGGHHLNRSPNISINGESNSLLPASPLSFSSNNISNSSSSVVDHQNGKSTSVTSLPTNCQVPFYQDLNNGGHGDILQQQQFERILQQRRFEQQKQLMMIQSACPIRPVSVQVDAGICVRRLTQFFYHFRHRPPENSITYWRKFVAEYYSPRARQKWCLSMHNNGATNFASQNSWHCDICHCKPGRGFEATVDLLPRFNEIKFRSGVVDERFFLHSPREFRFPTGLMILDYAKAIQETVYEQFYVIHEGQLRITFTADLKILSWEFCIRRHEELLPRRRVAPLAQVAQKCQTNCAEDRSHTGHTAAQELQTRNNVIITAARHLARGLELPALNEFGFSKICIRVLQIAEVVNGMSDIMKTTTTDRHVGPIAALWTYCKAMGGHRAPVARCHVADSQANRVAVQAGGLYGPAAKRSAEQRMVQHFLQASNGWTGVGPQAAGFPVYQFPGPNEPNRDISAENESLVNSFLNDDAGDADDWSC